MGLLTRLFDRKHSNNGAVADDRGRSQALAGRETGQTADEQAATRERMEAELDAQRERRSRALQDNA